MAKYSLNFYRIYGIRRHKRDASMQLWKYQHKERERKKENDVWLQAALPG